MQTTVIYHRADFDGLFCRAIASLFMPQAELIGWDFGDPALEFPDSDQVYIMDLPIDRPFGFVWDAEIHSARFSNKRIVWIDHHKSSIEALGQHWDGYRIDGVAACRLAWQWFTTSDKCSLPSKQDFIDRKVNEPWAVRLAGEYDIWDKRDPAADVFQHGLRSRVLNWERLFSDDDYVQELLQVGHDIEFVKTNENKAIIEKNGFTIQWEGLTFLACNAAQYNSYLFKEGIKPEHDALLGFCLRSNGKWSVSLYGVPGKPEIDLSAIAKKHGGGGHKQACGFIVDKLPFQIN